MRIVQHITLLCCIALYTVLCCIALYTVLYTALYYILIHYTTRKFPPTNQKTYLSGAFGWHKNLT